MFSKEIGFLKASMSKVKTHFRRKPLKKCRCLKNHDPPIHMILSYQGLTGLLKTMICQGGYCYNSMLSSGFPSK